MSLKAPKDIHSMSDLRVQIDQIDRELIAALALRQTYIDRAAEIKPAAGLPARIDERVQEVLNNVGNTAKEAGFDADLAQKMWTLMIDAMIDREEDFIDRAINPRIESRLACQCVIKDQDAELVVIIPDQSDIIGHEH